MAKKKFRETEIENYYDLKKDKVDELVAALKDEGGKTETFDDEFDIAKVTGEDPAETTGRFGKRKKFDRQIVAHSRVDKSRLCQVVVRGRGLLFRNNGLGRISEYG